MKPVALASLVFVLIASACVRTGSTVPTVVGQNPFTPAASPRLCAAADLQTSSNARENAGAVTLGVTLINASQRPCTLQNPPQVALLDVGRRLDIQPLQAETEHLGTLRLLPGESAVLVLIWRNQCGAALEDGPTIRLVLPDDENLDVPVDAASAPNCDAANDPSTLVVNPYSYPP